MNEVPLEGEDVPREGGAIAGGVANLQVPAQEEAREEEEGEMVVVVGRKSWCVCVCL